MEGIRKTKSDARRVTEKEARMGRVGEKQGEGGNDEES